MLRQMGVDVWLARGGAVEPLAELSVPQGDSATTRIPIATEQHARPVTPASSEPAPSKPPATVPDPAATQPRTAGSPIAPFSVLCLSKGRVLMFVEPGQSRAARRFALDLLAASSGVWGGESAHLAFDWPQPGIDNNPLTVRKALSAFVAKQLGDQNPSLVLIGREVAERLEQIPDDSIVLAPLPELMVEGELKRALWTELEGHR